MDGTKGCLSVRPPQTADQFVTRKILSEELDFNGSRLRSILFQICTWDIPGFVIRVFKKAPNRLCEAKFVLT